VHSYKRGYNPTTDVCSLDKPPLPAGLAGPPGEESQGEQVMVMNRPPRADHAIMKHGPLAMWMVII
jgi:hypothetical protein